MENSLSRKKGLFGDTRNLTILSVMLALTIILIYVGTIPLGSISATVSHIPTIITGIILGPLAGLIMGTLMGLGTLIRALTAASPIDKLFINPLLSVLPRMFIGVVSYYSFRSVKMIFKEDSLKRSVSAFVAGIAGSITNTVLVFLMLYLLYARRIVELMGAAFKTILITVLTSNAIAEALISAFVTMAIVMAYKNYSKSN